MRRQVLLLMLVTALLVAIPAGVATAAPKSGEVTVELITNKVSSITLGDTVWVSFLWTATGGEVSDFRVTATNEGHLTVSYPENTGSYTSLMADAELSDGEIDFTSIRLAVPYDSKNPRFRLKLSYLSEGKTHDRFVFEGKSTNQAMFSVPTVPFTGTDVSAVDYGEQVLPAESGGWIEVGYTGHAPVVNDFKVTVTDSAGIPVEYPQATYASLVHDSDLQVGETDVARVHLDTSGTPPGTYKVGVTATWSRGGAAGKLDSAITILIQAP